MSEDAFERLLASLPDPRRDEKPPYVQADQGQIKEARAVRTELDSYLDPKSDTETRTKYALEKLFCMKLRKDGDFQTIAGFRQVWRKKVADYVGSTPGVVKNHHTYVEVKGVSPGNRFAFGRLDKRNNPNELSQYEKLSAADKDGNIVLLAIGWWIAGRDVKPKKIQRGSKTYTKWYKDDLELEISLIPWNRWVEHCEGTKRRSITKTVCDREFPDCRIMKCGNRWATISHWWNTRYEEGGILYAR